MNINPLYTTGFCINSIRKLNAKSQIVTFTFFRVATELSAFSDLITISDRPVNTKTSTSAIISKVEIPSFSNPNSLNANE